MDEDLPIDIHYNKLIDWLLSRRHCPQNWQQLVLAVREKINVAIQDMPAVEDVAKLLHGAYINYFHCVEIVRLLKLTEDNSRNIFGRYSSQRLKDWTDILKLYEKDNIYLAEAAQLLARNVNFELPTVKRQIAKCTQSQQEYTRKEVDYAKLASELRENYASSCKQMGIEGKKLKREFLMLVRDLPSVYEDIAARLRPLNSAVQYYSNFVSFTLWSSDAGETRLPLLRFIISHGNTTCFEHRSGVKPTRVESSAFELSIAEDDGDDKQENEEKEDVIDWGDLDTSVVDADITNVDSATVLEVADMAAEIDWSSIDDLSSGIEIEVAGDVRDQQGVVDEEISDVNVARGPEALTLLDNVETRNTVVDELLELESFLEQRHAELTSGANDDVLSAVILQMAPQSVHANPQTILTMLADVRSVLADLTSQRMRNLMLIRSSPRYVDRLTATLEKLISDADKASSMSRLMVTRRAESVEEQRSLEPQLDLVRRRTKELQKQIETEISNRYKNRRVNIMGEINTV